MEKHYAIQTLKALAAGCCPQTGELLSKDSIWQDVAIQEVLQFSILTLESVPGKNALDQLQLTHSIVDEVIDVFKENKVRVTPFHIACFFGGVKSETYQVFYKHPYFGKLKDQLKIYSVQHLMLEYFQERFNYRIDQDAWQNIDFFEQPKFCYLKEQAIFNLGERVRKIPMKKTRNLSQNILLKRKVHRRSHEPWSTYEKELLQKAMKYTNDLDLLSNCFQRGQNSIKIYGQQLLFDQGEYFLKGE